MEAAACIKPARNAAAERDRQDVAANSVPLQCTTSELLAVMSSRLLNEGQIVFAGVGVPLFAATLAQELRCPGLTILFEGGVIGPR